jgi:hypothetical protein
MVLKKRLIFLSVLAIACTSPAWAQTTARNVQQVTGLERGNIETAFTFEWFKVKEVSGNTIQLIGSGGYLITDNIEAGLALAYNRTPDRTGGSVGVFGHWNFMPRQPFTPFVGVRLVPTYFADDKDLYKNSWELTGGVKLYPYPHAGASVAVFYGRSNLQNTLPGFGDTSSTYGLRAGMLFKF